MDLSMHICRHPALVSCNNKAKRLENNFYSLFLIICYSDCSSGCSFDFAGCFVGYSADCSVDYFAGCSADCCSY